MGQRRFAIIGHRVPASGKIILNDLAGGSGRLDVLCRAVNSALFLSHGIRNDSQIILHLLGGDGPPRRIRFDGEYLKGVRVEERAIAGHVAKIIAEPVPVLGQWISASPGIDYSGGGVEETVSDWDDKGVEIFTLNADGERLWNRDSKLDNVKNEFGKLGFFLSDDLDFTEHEFEFLKHHSKLRSIGDKWLQGHLAISIVHQFLDLGMDLNVS